MWMASTKTKIFYGTDADVVAEAAKRHEWRENGHSVENVTEGELSDFVTRDHRSAVRVYTEEEKKGRPDLQ